MFSHVAYRPTVYKTAIDTCNVDYFSIFLYFVEKTWFTFYIHQFSNPLGQSVLQHLLQKSFKILCTMFLAQNHQWNSTEFWSWVIFLINTNMYSIYAHLTFGQYHPCKGSSQNQNFLICTLDKSSCYPQALSCEMITLRILRC